MTWIVRKSKNSTKLMKNKSMKCMKVSTKIKNSMSINLNEKKRKEKKSVYIYIRKKEKDIIRFAKSRKK